MLHLDASRHPNPDLHQLINCIYYCSPDWQPEWGGGLEFWNADATECGKQLSRCSTAWSLSPPAEELARLVVASVLIRSTDRVGVSSARGAGRTV